MAEHSEKTTLLSNRSFDALKWIAQIALPAAGTLYFALASIWRLPNAEQVVGTITAVDAFLGLLLGLSTKSYNNSGAKYDGAVYVTDDEDGSKHLTLAVPNSVMDVAGKDEVRLRVQK